MSGDVNTTNDRKFRPIDATKEISSAYKRYILSTFSTDNENYNQQIHEMINGRYTLVKGPYLQITDNYRRSGTLRELAERGLITKGFLKLGADKLTSDFVPYAHQTKALENIISNDRNTVVSTGTGSGKTESFLIPILDHLLREEENGTLSQKGVRAMIIYPMNALVNDQIKRLRRTLEKHQTITFGAFTGETENEQKVAIREYRDRFGYEPLKNEIISRDEMKDSPPHIIITNYAMLEHILIKPENSVNIFSGESNSRWKYIVLDEAHTYGGAKGTEVSMLLRRVKATLKNDDVRFILTSATLGDEDCNDDVAEFAKNLTGSEFSGSDVIRAEYDVPALSQNVEDRGGRFYTELAKVVHDEIEMKKLYPGTEDPYFELSKTILSEKMFWEIRKNLEKVKTIDDLALDTGYSTAEIEDFVHVATASKDRDGRKLFDAKYHVFVRAIKGVYVSLGPSWKLSFIPSKSLMDGDTEYAAFQMSSCYNCGTAFITGKEDNGVLKQTLDSSVERNQDEIRDSLYHICGEDEIEGVDNEEDAIQFFYLCSKCGAISPAFGDRSCECGSKYQNLVRKLTDDGSSEKLCTCPVCDQRNTKIGIAREFYLGSEAASSVLASALYHQLPSPDSTNHNLGGQFVMFSDSRGGASYAAVNLEDTYKNVLMHRAITEVTKQKPNVFKDGIMFNDFVEHLADLLSDLFGPGVHRSQLKKDAAIAMVKEASCNNSSKSLEFKGLFRFEGDVSDIAAFGGLSKEETEVLCNTLIKYVRDIGAIIRPDLLNDLDFKSAVPYPTGIVKKNGERGKYDKVFLTKKMSSYLKRFMDSEKVDVFVNAFFDKYMKLIDKTYRLDLSQLIIVPSPTHYFCSKCRKFFPFSVNNTCPRCASETLTEVESDFNTSMEHYTYLYRESPLIPLSVEEHTAQLSKKRSTKFQEDFSNKKINALSCSTTFEMGVDLGDLETVFLRNVPPSPSNYIQRAGRAGRGKNTSAFVLTFCKGASHDSHYFDRPEAMICGRVGTPIVNTCNAKIAIRHIFASSLSYYWRLTGSTPKNSSTIMDQDYLSEFYSYLESHPADLKEFLKEFVPKEDDFQKYRSDDTIISIDDFGWIECLNDIERGRMEIARSVFESDMQNLEESMKSAIEAGRSGTVRMIMDTIKTLKEENTLSFLSRNNVLPKYGFPVDTVKLENVNRYSEKEFELSRDLALAITEYAPESQVIANKKLITSGFVKKVKGLEWDRYAYSACENCNAVTAKRTIGDDERIICEVCGQENTPSGKFIIPKFGFQYNKEESANIYKPRKAHGIDYQYRERMKGELVPFEINRITGSIQYNHDDELVAISNDRYRICEFCGRGFTENTFKKEQKKESKGHENPYEGICKGSLRPFKLGHIFKTDVTVIHFNLSPQNKDEQISVLYSLINGLCSAFDIERKEVSGCLRPNRDGSYDYVLFDNTPGGAGYVKKITPSTMPTVINSSLDLLENCDCGGERGDCSCYSCLKDYTNQKYHDVLNRGAAMRYLTQMRDME